MTRIPGWLKNDQLRAQSLNALLIIIFACAWAYDKWPEAATLEAGIAVFAIFIQLLVLWGAVRLHRAENSANYVESSSRELDYYDVDINGRVEFPHYVIEQNYNLAPALRPMTRVNWVRTSQHEEIMRAYLRMVMASRAQALPVEMRDWSVEGIAPGVFNVAAGPFIIEHFHGKTNIRVLDVDSVTIELSSKDKENLISSGNIFNALKPVYN